MKLYLLRHGSAVAIGERGVGSDEERMLTKEGRNDTEDVLRSLRKVCRPQGIWTSPLVRARETAEIARSILEVPTPLSCLDILVAGADVAAVVKWLRTRREESLMLVGHMPDLAILATFLVCGEKEEGLALKKSGICCIEFDEAPVAGTGRLVWLVSPSLLSRID